MPTLITTPNLPDPDSVFEALMNAHRDLDPTTSRQLDAKLVLLLANHIGDPDIVKQAIKEALLFL